MGSGDLRQSGLVGSRRGTAVFMQVQLAGGKLRGGTDESAQKLSALAATELGSAVRPEDVTLPPYYPRILSC